VPLAFLLCFNVFKAFVSDNVTPITNFWLLVHNGSLVSSPLHYPCL
jgi:hypothetical protein